MSIVNPSQLTPTIGELQSKVDYATRAQLSRYDDGRVWCLVLPSLSLSGLAWASLHNPQLVLDCVDAGQILVLQSLKQVPGNAFWCIHFEDSYWIELYRGAIK